MLQEPPDKLVGLERHYFFLPRSLLSLYLKDTLLSDIETNRLLAMATRWVYRPRYFSTLFTPLNAFSKCTFQSFLYNLSFSSEKTGIVWGKFIVPSSTAPSNSFTIVPLNIRDNTFAGRKNFFLELFHSMPSSDSPPAGTSIWMWGWNNNVCVHVCNTARAPDWAPRKSGLDVACNKAPELALNNKE